MDRLEKLLGGLAPDRDEGLEIGALANPILRRPASSVLYVDHADTATLRRKYEGIPGVSVEDIVPVDIVWGDRPLADTLVPPDRRFAHVVASHVLEHVPDPIWWLDELASVLAPGGSIRLIVPDRRFTFDIARRETTLADVLAWNLERRRAPGPREIIDFYCNHRDVDPKAAWDAARAASPAYPDGVRVDNVPHALGLAEAARGGAYHDVHCSVFTPTSFAILMERLASLGRLRLACTALYDTAENEIDFFVHMAECDDAEAAARSWSDAASRLAAAATAPECPAPARPGWRARLRRLAAR